MKPNAHWFKLTATFPPIDPPTGVIQANLTARFDVKCVIPPIPYVANILLPEPLLYLDIAEERRPVIRRKLAIGLGSCDDWCCPPVAFPVPMVYERSETITVSATPAQIEQTVAHLRKIGEVLESLITAAKTWSATAETTAWSSVPALKAVMVSGDGDRARFLEIDV